VKRSLKAGIPSGSKSRRKRRLVREYRCELCFHVQYPSVVAQRVEDGYQGLSSGDLVAWLTRGEVALRNFNLFSVGSKVFWRKTDRFRLVP